MSVSRTDWSENGRECPLDNTTKVFQNNQLSKALIDRFGFFWPCPVLVDLTGFPTLCYHKHHIMVQPVSISIISLIVWKILKIIWWFRATLYSLQSQATGIQRIPTLGGPGVSSATSIATYPCLPSPPQKGLSGSQGLCGEGMGPRRHHSLSSHRLFMGNLTLLHFFPLYHWTPSSLVNPVSKGSYWQGAGRSRGAETVPGWLHVSGFMKTSSSCWFLWQTLCAQGWGEGAILSKSCECYHNVNVTTMASSVGQMQPLYAQRKNVMETPRGKIFPDLLMHWSCPYRKLCCHCDQSCVCSHCNTLATSLVQETWSGQTMIPNIHSWKK